MSTDRVAAVERKLDEYLEGAAPAARRLGPGDPLRPGSTLPARKAIELFEDQVLSRALDVAARELKKTGEAFYTISSAGHEQDVSVGALLRTTDPAFLHYRSGALMMARWRQAPGSTPAYDTALSLVASADDPISGGRHKVWGSRELWVPPQTSTIGSHVPKATGTAFAVGRARRLGMDSPLPADSVVLCSFGDASCNHATTLAGINAARYGHMRGNPMPILFLCEDNRRGISVETPVRWVHDFFSRLPHLHYFEAEGQIDDIWEVARLAVQTCRSQHVPVFLHLRCVRLWGHAGSDMESAYLPPDKIQRIEAKDPILNTARRLVETGAARPDELAALVADTRQRVHAVMRTAAKRPKLTTRAAVVAPLAPYDDERCRRAATTAVDAEQRTEKLGDALPENAESGGRRTLAAHINAALADEMIRRPEILIFGEDVGIKGGVYGVTRGLQERFGQARVFDTLLDETSILGVAQGSAHLGLLPIPEIQYLAYVHNAIDQLRGEASSLSFFSAGQYTNPLVVRVAGLGYQKGFGGHFHNDNSLGALREIPGLMIAIPARGDDAARMLRGCVATAVECGRVVCFLEPIALYHERDLHEAGDGEWLSDYPPPDGSSESALLPGDVGVYAEGNTDLLIASYANGLRLSLRAARMLESEHGLRARVLDLRWLAPLPLEAFERHARECDRVLVVDECRATGAGIADALVAHLMERGFASPVRSVRAADSFVPLGSASELVLVGEEDIVSVALELKR
jgi:2-oxoisovalerate dehydrogenase E1 component